MGIIGAAMGMGMVLGPGIGGYFASVSLSIPFYFASSLSILALLSIMLVLPESLPAEKRSRVFICSGPQLGQMWKSLFGPLGYLFILAFLINWAMANFEGVFGLYASHRYGYGADDVGLIFTMIGLISTGVQGLLTGPFTHLWGENRLIQISLFASSVGFALMLLANNYAGSITHGGIFCIKQRHAPSGCLL